MSGFANVDEDIDRMAMYWMRRKSEYIDAAACEFQLYVDPLYFHEEHPSQTKLNTVNAYFTEWVLFERVLREGMTPLEVFIATKPIAMPKKSWARLKQVAETHFFSRFAICAKDVRRGTAVLRDVRSDARYTVFDEHLCQTDRWRDGTLAERIACVDGDWMAIGQARLYDVASPEHTAIDGPGEIHPEEEAWLPDAMRESYYLRVLHDTMGIDGRYAPSLRIRE